MPVLGGGLRVTVEATVEPPLGEVERTGGILAGSVAGRALVERHHDVGADGTLGVDDALGSEQMPGPVDMRPEVAPLLLELTACGERKDLEPAAVGEHGPLPGGETVDAPGLLDDGHAGPEVKMVGIGENDLRLGLVADVAVEKPLDRGGRADGHEDGRADDPVVGAQHPGAGLRSRVPVFEREIHVHSTVQK